MPSTDQQLARRARDGSPDAVAALFDRHWSSAWRVAYGITGVRALADDVAQDAVERAMRNLGQYDAERPFGAWFHRIVVNRAHDVMRRERRLTGLDDMPEPAAPGDHDDAVLRAQVRAAIAALDIDRRTVVVLHHWLGYPLAEVAALLDVPLGTVHSRLSRALGDLRRRLEVGDAGRPR